MGAGVVFVFHIYMFMFPRGAQCVSLRHRHIEDLRQADPKGRTLKTKHITYKSTHQALWFPGIFKYGPSHINAQSACQSIADPMPADADASTALICSITTLGQSDLPTNQVWGLPTSVLRRRAHARQHVLFMHMHSCCALAGEGVDFGSANVQPAFHKQPWLNSSIMIRLAREGQ